ncbi:MAG: methyltransferase domain-containing protein [Candidatus Omnitrophica bacterium]|nr:methyltransferase domain-containing protein [Candidatus Omnitrophota bacterium]
MNPSEQTIISGRLKKIVDDENFLTSDQTHQIYNKPAVDEFLKSMKKHKTGRLKSVLMQNPVFYNSIRWLIGPTYLGGSWTRTVREEVEKVKSGGFAVNLGGGTKNYGKSVINVDVFASPHVHMLCNLQTKVFKENALDLIIAENLIEHISDPENFIDKIYNALKPGGRLIIDVPFICSFHATWYDYTRWTSEGFKNLLSRRFKITHTKIKGGPASGLCWILRDFFSLLLSFGSSRLFYLWQIILLPIFAPVKFLDIILNRHPEAHVVSMGFWAVAEK